MSITRIILILLAVAIGSSLYFLTRKTSMTYAEVNSAADAIKLFPCSVAQIEQMTKESLAQAKKQLDDIIAVPHEQRTYANTVAELDNLNAFSNAVIVGGIISTLDLVHPDQAIRDAARDAVKSIQNFFIDNVSMNRDLYNGFKYYVENNAQNEQLSAEQVYYIQETLKDFKRSGLDLPDDQLEELKRIQKELVDIALDFDKNIAQDKSSIEVTTEELAGLPEDYIKNLPKTDDEKYIVHTNMPNFNQIMENCTVATTREKFWNAYNNRAYPANQKVLEDLIAKRYETAQILGFPTYAALELDAEMVQNPDRAVSFLNNLVVKAQKKAAQEVQDFTHPLPQGVTLAYGKLQPWDFNFVKTAYKKAKYNLDENKIAEYFPMQSTIDSLLDIYQKFFDLEFKQVPVPILWDPEVKLIEVFDKTRKEKLGYLFMDLYPRPNKYSHACEHTIIPVAYSPDGKPNLGVAIVIANFPKPMTDKPSLLLLKDVNTFFHEFGHAMHALLGRTKVASFSGTHVKRDFVEMPSQMLEEWLWDPEILKMVSKHYQTGTQLPDDLIAQILKARTFDSGFHITRQLFIANLSLDYFNNGPKIDPAEVLKQLRTQVMPFVNSDPRDHFYASFGHLTGYGARYYGYMWSKVFAHDLFNEIKKIGLLDPIIGRKYVDAVIGRGGSKDPNDLLKDFLSREPNQDAFLHDMGLQ
ncbi:MAG: peptidase M3 [Candidatus Babeliales bacterium]